MKTKNISIIIPVYNVEKYLNDCIDSVLAQTLQDIEIILIDDGSTDNCGNICDAYAIKDKRIIVIHKQNGGLSSARNMGIKNATGMYLFFLDSDDILLDDNTLEKIWEAIIHCMPEVACFLIQKTSEESVLLNDKYQKFANTSKIFNGMEIIEEHIFDLRIITMAQNKICRRDFCIDNNLFFCEDLYHEDDEWIPRLLVVAKKIIFINIYAYGYRQRENSITTNMDEKKVAKRATDKLKIAYNTLKFLETKWEHNKLFKGITIQYYLIYFSSNIVTYYSILSKENKEFLYKGFSEYWNIFKFAKYSRSYKQRILYIVNLLLKQRITMKVLKRRYLWNRGKKYATKS